jgi:2-oxoglutarate ferredoxin oxidoreductase subunit delta
MSGMAEAAKPGQQQGRGQLRIDEEECKGCGLCIEACPPKAIAMSERLNHYGYRTALYAGAGCTGCGICFMVCPEPGAITVYRLVSAHEESVRPVKAQAGGVDAASTAGLETGATRGAGAAGRAGGATECASN